MFQSGKHIKIYVIQINSKIIKTYIIFSLTRKIFDLPRGFLLGILASALRIPQLLLVRASRRPVCQGVPPASAS